LKQNKGEKVEIKTSENTKKISKVTRFTKASWLENSKVYLQQWNIGSNLW